MRTLVLTAWFLAGLALSADAAEGTDASPPVRPTIEDEHAPVPVPEPSTQARRYHATGNALWAADQFWTGAVTALVLFSGASARIRDLSRRLGRFGWLTAGVYALLYSMVHYVLSFPLNYYQGFVRQHAYGLSNQTGARWLGHSLLHLSISAGVGFLFTWVPFLLIRRSPRRWWLYTTILVVPFFLGVALVKPVWVDPLFNNFGPMRNQALEAKILAQAQRAGIDGGRVFEVNKSRDTNAVNAYVTGLLGTKRIVLWDTLTAKLDEKEVLFVLGHEMGHYALGHVVRSILLSTVLVLATLFWVDRAGRWTLARFREGFGFDRLSDVASVPLILLLMQAAALVLTPVANAYSRYQEHEADCFALELTHANRSGALAFVKLQEKNLSNPRPGLFYKLFRASHPSIGERIDFCNRYQPWTTGRAQVYAQYFRD